MRVQIVDPSAQTPPFDRALAAALARAGADVELLTSGFIHGEVAEPTGYTVDESFYRRSSSMPSGTFQRRALGMAEHVPGMLRARRRAAGADVVHYQWLTLPGIDAALLPKAPAKVWTTHGFLRASDSGGPGGLKASLRALERMDAVIALSEYGAASLESAGVDRDKIHLIPHGAFDYLTELPERPLPPELEGATGPVILFFGLIRPYKGADVLLRAFAEMDVEGAEVWIAGRPLGVDMDELRRQAESIGSTVRFVDRFISDSEVPALMRRADVVTLPYRDVEQSGVLYTALAFGKAIVATDVGGFPEVAASGDGETIRLVPPGDHAALAEALTAVISEPAERARLEAAAAAAAAGPYSWDSIAAQTLALYGQLLGEPPMIAVAIAFWASVAGIVHTHVTYPLSLAALTRLRRRSVPGTVPGTGAPVVSLIIAAHNEEGLIEERVRNALETDYPRELLEVIVASDGSEDRTVELARAAGADHVLDLTRRGKVEAQNAAVAQARGEILAFSDANSMWAPDAIRVLVAAFAEPDVGYVCGQLRLTGGEGENQEGAYWRYEMAVRSLESGLGGVTAGNGAIYAVRSSSYVEMPSDRSHDLCLPYLTVKSGMRAIYEPAAQAIEPAAPTLAGEWQRKRRMMNRAWGILLNDGILSPRGYGLSYAYEIFSHRALRYATPFLHLIALGANIALLGEGTIYVVTLAAQVGLLAAAVLARVIPALPFRIAAYYVTVTASIAAGLYDRIRRGPAKTWEPAAR